MRRRRGMMPLPMVACAAALLVSGCMSGPIPVSSTHAGDNGATASGPSEGKLPAAPAVRSSPP